MTHEREHVQLGELSVAYRRAGAGEVLVFLRDQGYSEPWIELYDELASSFDVVIPDHPGFGETELPESIRDFNDLVVHYAEFLDSLLITRAHLLGHGFGGWIAAEFAAVYPERVASLTLVAPTGLLPDIAEPMVDPYRMSREKWLDVALGGDASEFAHALEGGDFGEQMIEDYEERMGVARVAWNPRYSLRLETRLRRIGAPAQVLVPQHDGLVAPSIARRYTELLPTAPAPITVAGTATPTEHLIVLQEPGQIARLVEGMR